MIAGDGFTEPKHTINILTYYHAICRYLMTVLRIYIYYKKIFKYYL
ncbi:hypothetical protein NIES4103_68060 [Nostoc sp. NIES-4103]|nr:hypothetical protein NIES4103_68060 [Nostoc sp. NIES-4103]